MIPLTNSTKIRLFNPIDIKNYMPFWYNLYIKYIKKDNSVKENFNDDVLHYVFDQFSVYMDNGGMDYVMSIIQNSEYTELQKLDYYRVIDLYYWWNTRKQKKSNSFNEDTNNFLRLISLRYIFADGIVFNYE